jgi:hypothetical protein
MINQTQKPMVKNASDESQVKYAQVKEKLAADKQHNDIKFILATEQGRRFLWELLSSCGVYRQSADHSGSWTYFNEGKRSIGLEVLTQITAADPDSYLKMIKESKKEKI